MNRFCAFIFIILLPFFVGCASLGAQKQQALDLAVSQGPDSVKKLCVDDKLAGACALSGSEVRAVHVVPVMQSLSANTQVRIILLVPSGKGLSYYLKRKDGSVQKLIPEIAKHNAFKYQLDQIDIFSLAPDQEYELLVIGPNADLWDKRKFKALDLKKKRARVALVSCMDDSLSDVQKQIWPELVSQNPDVVVFAGDNVYADSLEGRGRAITSADQLWQRYIETRSRLEFFRSSTLIPVIATWDDHDYGKNDGDRTFALKNESTDVFFAFFPQRKPVAGFESGPGVASRWTAFGVQFALLDDRSFRSPNKTEIPGQTHFGLDQERWIKDGLVAAKTPIFLLSGDQFFGGYHDFESYEGSHAKNFKEQLSVWRKAASRPVVFLSGDRHLTEIIKVPAEHLGFATFEITSSGLHSKVYADAFQRAPSPAQLAGRAGEYNYTILEIMNASKSQLQLDVKSFGLGKKMLYQQTLMVKH